MTASVAWPDPHRRVAFERWFEPLRIRHGLDAATLRAASADASFRRYLRVDGGAAAEAVAASSIVMDAPPPQEDVRPFVRVAALLRAAGLAVPAVHAVDEEHGFLLLDDLGPRSYLDALREAAPADADRLMRDAVAALVQLQSRVPAAALPPFGAAAVQGELDLFATWCVEREHGRRWSDAEHAAWRGVCARLVDTLTAQPVVAVHADWMPRNLMLPLPGQRQPGVLDFQDAVAGPATYDIASLLRDAFVSWPEEQELDWAVRHWQAARAAGVPLREDFGEHWRELEWTGLQRHLKVIGIFCRLKHRDGKPQYARDLPRFFGYATKVALRYRPLQPLLRLLEPLSGATVAAGFTF